MIIFPLSKLGWGMPQSMEGGPLPVINGVITAVMAYKRVTGVITILVGL